MGDTIIKWFADLTTWIGSVTVLPGEGGLRASFNRAFESLSEWAQDSFRDFASPGFFGDVPPEHKRKMNQSEHESMMMDRLAGRLVHHVGHQESEKTQDVTGSGNDLERDILFYNYVLARECRNLQKDLSASPPKQYDWGEWEFFLTLMGNAEDPEDFPGQKHPDILVPDRLRAPKDMFTAGTAKLGRSGSEASDEDQEAESGGFSSSNGDTSPDRAPVDGNIDRETSVVGRMSERRKESKRRRRKDPDSEPEYLLNWSWLSDESPLMSQKSEAEWILDRLSAALERELNRQRKGYKRKPPISLKDVGRSKGQGAKGAKESTSEDRAHDEEQRELQKAASSEE